MEEAEILAPSHQAAKGKNPGSRVGDDSAPEARGRGRAAPATNSVRATAARPPPFAASLRSTVPCPDGGFKADASRRASPSSLFPLEQLSFHATPPGCLFGAACFRTPDAPEPERAPLRRRLGCPLWDGLACSPLQEEGRCSARAEPATPYRSGRFSRRGAEGGGWRAGGGRRRAPSVRGCGRVAPATNFVRASAAHPPPPAASLRPVVPCPDGGFKARCAALHQHALPLPLRVGQAHGREPFPRLRDLVHGVACEHFPADVLLT